MFVKMERKIMFSKSLMKAVITLALVVCDDTLETVINADSLVLWDTYFDQFQFWTNTVSGIGACAKACVRMKICMSFNYGLTDRSCELNSELLSQYPDLRVTKEHTVYSKIEDWPAEVRNQTWGKGSSLYKLSQRMTTPTKWHVRPAKTQISLGIRSV